MADTTIFECRRNLSGVPQNKFKCVKCGERFPTAVDFQCHVKNGACAAPCGCGGKNGRHHPGCGQMQPPEDFPGKEK